MTFSRLATYVSLLTLTGMLLAILAVAVSEVHSFDVFWQLQNGRYMAETHSFIRTDLFTLAADVPRHEHTWLHSLILYGLYSFAGYGAISIFKGVLITATAWFLILAARRRESSWAAIALVLPVFLLTSGGWLERPQLWTFLGTAIFIYWLVQQPREPGWRLFWLLPVALFWSNMHAGSILALALVAACLVGETGQALIERRFSWRIPARWSALLFGVLLAGLANPYPARWFNTLLGSYNLGASVDSAGKVTGSKMAVFNMDWTPTTFQNEALFFYAVAVAALIMLLGWRRLRLADLCLLAGLALMGTRLVRHIPFFYLGVVAILPAYLDRIAEPVRQQLPKLSRKLALLVVCALALGSFWFFWQPIYQVYGLFNTGLRSWHYPIAATEFVEQHRLPKNLYNTYDWGGYMAFKLYPDYLMFWDGRQNSAEMFSLGWNVMAGKPDWQRILDRFEVKTIVTRASTIDTGQTYPLLDRLRDSADWSLVFSSDSSLVFVLNDSVSADWLQRFARPKERIDDTVLSEAHLMVSVNPNRYMAWWEMAQIYTQRKQYQHALFALNQHIARAPQRNPAAEKLRDQLIQALNASSKQ
jgi:hypothetical protein